MTLDVKEANVVKIQLAFHEEVNLVKEVNDLLT
jgi:hypothetical protein